MSLKTVTFDVETTGIDVENDRIITCFMRVRTGDVVDFERNWVVNPGVEVPEGAAEVHGMTTQWVQENGRSDVSEAISEIVDLLESYAREGYLVVGYNSSFDLSFLDAESKRHRQGRGLNLDGARFLDPIILSRKFNRFRKGGHKLVDIARDHGFEVDEDKAHAADYDVTLTEHITPKLLNVAWRELRAKALGLTPDEFLDKLQTWQVEWKTTWATELTSYFKRIKKTEEDGSQIIVDGSFPW